MINDKEFNENQAKIEENTEKNSKNIGSTPSSVNIDDKDKIETKGLKLKKSTKERLNLLQGSFDDAESMVVALLNQYEVFKLESNDKFADRKAEIERFNFLMESIKGCFVNSLEMATYIEDKFTENMKKEVRKKERVISLLQDENNSLNNKIREYEASIDKKNKELEDVKESFSRVNLALTTVEKELSEKSKVIENLQSHINSLSAISNDDKGIKDENFRLKEALKDLEVKLTESRIETQKFEHLKNDNYRYVNEIAELKKEKNEYKQYYNELNNRIQQVLIEKSLEISKVNNEKAEALREIEINNAKELKEANFVISKLKDELYELKLILSKKEDNL